MTEIIATNAPERYDADRVLAGYALPETDPTTIEIRWAPKRHDRDDEYFYRVEWPGGIYADMFTVPNSWHDIFVRAPTLVDRDYPTSGK